MHCPDDDEELELFYKVTKKQIEHGFLAERPLSKPPHRIPQKA
jgi:hypothetical protein